MKESKFSAFTDHLMPLMAAILVACSTQPDPTLDNPLGSAPIAGSIGTAGSQPPTGIAGSRSGTAGTAAATAGRSGQVTQPAAGRSGDSAGTGPNAAGSTAAGTTAAASGGTTANAGSNAGEAGAAGAAIGGAGSAAGSGGSYTAGSSAAGSNAGSAGSAANAGAGGPAPVEGATFTEIYPKLMAGCSCHGAGAGGLMFGNRTNTYRNLVAATSSSCSGEKRVVAGDPSKSVLVHSLEHTRLGSCSVPTMPRNAGKWSQSDIALVKSWISAGALDN